MAGAEADATNADEFLAWQKHAYLTRSAIYENLSKTDQKI